MERQRAKRKKNKIMPVFIIFALLGYVLIQWYLINRNKIETVKATEGYINDSIISHGIICRNEIVMSQEISGAIDYDVENGQRVSNGMSIGQIYSTEQDVEFIQKAGDIAVEIDNLSSAQSFMTNVNVDISMVRKQLNNNIINLSAVLAQNNYVQTVDILSEITLGINKINMATDKAGDLENSKTELLNYRSQILNMVSAPLGRIYSEHAGYFIKSTDGYEDIATVEHFINITPQEGEDIIAHSVAINNDNRGKIITDYKWSLCTYVTNQQAEKLSQGSNVKIAIGDSHDKYQKALISQLITFEDKTLVVLQSSDMDKDSASLRVTECEILFSQYRGIKIPKSALHIENGNLGVYVKFAKLVQFKKVKPIYEDANYIILPLTTDENNQVSLYDDVIVKGVNLYNGKYL